MKSNRRHESVSETLRLGQTRIPILFENQSLLAIDKPAGWIVTTPKWNRTRQNLQRELELAIERRAPWVTHRNIRFLRFVHRLDRETSGVLLLAKNKIMLSRLSELFKHHSIQKLYLCEVSGRPSVTQWHCTAKIAPSPAARDRVAIDNKKGQDASTTFVCLASLPNRSLILAAPITGRTHQIRIHLNAADLPILGDPLYGNKRQQTQGPQTRSKEPSLALRAWSVEMPLDRRKPPLQISASIPEFASKYNLAPSALSAPNYFSLLGTEEKMAAMVTTKTGRLPKSQ